MKDRNTCEVFGDYIDIYDITQNADSAVIEQSKRELGQMEVILGHDDTIKSLVDDILIHKDDKT